MQRQGQSKAETQELCEQRREREISPCSLRSSGLNLHNQLDVSCICGISEQTTNHAKIEVVNFGSNCRLGVCYLSLTSFLFLFFNLPLNARSGIQSKKPSSIKKTYLILWIHSFFYNIKKLKCNFLLHTNAYVRMCIDVCTHVYTYIICIHIHSLYIYNI